MFPFSQEVNFAGPVTGFLFFTPEKQQNPKNL